MLNSGLVEGTRHAGSTRQSNLGNAHDRDPASTSLASRPHASAFPRPEMEPKATPRRTKKRLLGTPNQRLRATANIDEPLSSTQGKRKATSAQRDRDTAALLSGITAGQFPAKRRRTHGDVYTIPPDTPPRTLRRSTRNARSQQASLRKPSYRDVSDDEGDQDAAAVPDMEEELEEQEFPAEYAGRHTEEPADKDEVNQDSVSDPVSSHKDEKSPDESLETPRGHEHQNTEPVGESPTGKSPTNEPSPSGQGELEDQGDPHEALESSREGASDIAAAEMPETRTERGSALIMGIDATSTPQPVTQENDNEGISEEQTSAHEDSEEDQSEDDDMEDNEDPHQQLQSDLTNSGTVAYANLLAVDEEDFVEQEESENPETGADSRENGEAQRNEVDYNPESSVESSSDSSVYSEPTVAGMSPELNTWLYETIEGTPFIDDWITLAQTIKDSEELPLSAMLSNFNDVYKSIDGLMEVYEEIEQVSVLSSNIIKDLLDRKQSTEDDLMAILNFPAWLWTGNHAKEDSHSDQVQRYLVPRLHILVVLAFQGYCRSGGVASFQFKAMLDLALAPIERLYALWKGGYLSGKRPPTSWRLRLPLKRLQQALDDGSLKPSALSQSRPARISPSVSRHPWSNAEDQALSEGLMAYRGEYISFPSETQAFNTLTR